MFPKKQGQVLARDAVYISRFSARPVWIDPPPSMSVTGGREPRALNSTVVPAASPAARPSRQPRIRSRSIISPPQLEGLSNHTTLPGGVATHQASRKMQRVICRGNQCIPVKIRMVFRSNCFPHHPGSSNLWPVQSPTSGAAAESRARCRSRPAPPPCQKPAGAGCTFRHHPLSQSPTIPSG